MNKHGSTYKIMQKVEIPLSVISNLLCCHCGKFLSCGPVHLVPTNGSALCGRCKNLAKAIFRNTSFEVLAPLFLYPCVNWETQCPKFFEWNEGLQHERVCSYKGCLKFFCVHPGACCSGKRHLPSSGGNVFQPIPEEALERLECVICSGYLSCAPVYLTQDSHHVCHRCVRSQENLQGASRNLAYETLASILIFPCIFKNRGCPARYKFGQDIDFHEMDCSYTKNHAKPIVTDGKIKEKTRGVIQTHTGHIFGTLNPNYLPAFAPPTNNYKFDKNKELMKSLQKKQNKQRNRVNDGNFHSRDNSLDSTDTNSDGRSTPGRDENILNVRALDQQVSRQYPPGAGYNNNAYQRDNYQPPPVVQQPRDSNKPRYSNSQGSRGYNNMAYPQNYPVGRSNSMFNNLNVPPPNYVHHHQSLQEYDYSRMGNQQGYPGPNNIVQRVSSRREDPLLQELRRKQVVRNNSQRTSHGVPNPYQQCNNLNDLRQAHSRLNVPAGIYS